VSASGTEADAPTKLSATGQDVADRSRQLRPYRRWQRQQIKLHLAQPYDADWRELARWLSRMTLDDGDALVEYVCNTRWLLEAGMAARQAALSVISGRIITLRLMNGYPPIDDALPGEPDTAFQEIRTILNVL
jgi:hypothetical protein